MCEMCAAYCNIIYVPEAFLTPTISRWAAIFIMELIFICLTNIINTAYDD
jgi:hypothetical protein